MDDNRDNLSSSVNNPICFMPTLYRFN
jgi:hypothetical protein